VLFRSRDGREQSKQRLEQSRFARTIRTENGGEAGAGNREREPGKHRLAVVADAQVVQCDESFIHIIGDILSGCTAIVNPLQRRERSERLLQALVIW
jgi:hypothetical protein